MRNTYIVSYDVSDPKRLRLVHKKLEGYGDWMQYSVFLCDLSPKELALLRESLRELIHHEEDQVMIVDLGVTGGRISQRFDFLGRPGQRKDRRSVIV